MASNINKNSKIETKIGARVLLKHLREAMAQPLGAQERLDKIVHSIASAMQADVCSVYILRNCKKRGDILELCATFGLNIAAVHKAHLKLGQGLIGTIAKRGQLLNIADAQQHPFFSYQPEVGEDEYHSFLGVPMRRAGQTMGVIIVRRKDFKIYPLEEVESLETAAMVLSDLVANGDIVALSENNTNKSISSKGKILSPGIAVGKIILHDSRVIIKRLFNDDAALEKQRLAIAIKSLRASFDSLLDERLGDKGEHVDVLTSLRMFAYDRGWIRRISEAIDDGLTAEAATKKVAQDNRLRLNHATSPYLRERLEDFDDLTRRLLRHLIGENEIQKNSQQKIIIVAKSISAAELFDYAKQNLKGLVVEKTTPTSHTIIVARALGICVVQIKDIVNMCENGDVIIVDGTDGSIHLRPSHDLQQTYQSRKDFSKHFASLKKLPNTTKDGIKIKLLLNGGLDVDIKQLKQTAADGIGLFRTELNFMLATSLPKLNQQVEFYKNILELAQPKEICFRTLDIGGDKLLPYLPNELENNPAMGWRAIRLSIDRPALLRIQLRALLRAASNKDLRIKLPMISEINEIKIAKKLLEQEIKIHKQFNYQMPNSIKLGAMIEVPGILWQLDELMNEVDFVSVGSNDLFQFMTASDRTNSALANRYNPISHSFFRALREIVTIANKHNKPLYLCGELAGEPLAALGLLAIGYRAISMSPGSIGPVKEMLRQVNLTQIAKIINKALDDKNCQQSLYEILLNCAKNFNIKL